VGRSLAIALKRTTLELVFVTMVSHAVDDGDNRRNTSCRTERISELFTTTHIARLLFAITDPSIRFFTCSKSFPVSCALSQQSLAIFLQALMFELSRIAPSTVAPALSNDSFPPLSALSLNATPPPKATSSTTRAVVKPVQTCVFLTIPLEIRNEIYPYILVHDRHIDITIPHKKHGVIPVRFKNYMLDLKNVLQACEQTEREGMDFVYSPNQFYSKNGNTISRLAILLGETGTSCIQYLDLNTHFMMKIHNRHVWSSSLEFIVKHSPSPQEAPLEDRIRHSSGATSGDTR
jgi:hypothetical protein